MLCENSSNQRLKMLVIYNYRMLRILIFRLLKVTARDTRDIYLPDANVV